MFEFVIKAFIGFLILAVVGLVVGMVAYGITWLATPYGPNFEVQAKVKSLSYKPSSTSTGTGIGANGQTVVTTNYESEEYNVVFKLETGGLYTVDDESLFTDVEQGEKVTLTVRSKKVWGNDCWDLVSWRKQ